MFQVAKIYAYFYFFLKKYFGIRIPGLGRALRMVRKTKIIDVKGLKLHFSPMVASEYGTHIIGKWQEPETHGFFRRVLENRNDCEGLFIDVGANIGIFLLDVARISKFRVVGFEPSLDCVDAIKRSLELNGVKNSELFDVLVGASNSIVPFQIHSGAEGASIHNSVEAPETKEMVTLDSVRTLQVSNVKHCIMLIDVEGYELEVIKGARKFIDSNSPLIVFEFNHVSRKYFTLSQVLSEIGPDYSLYRLRKDSFLDRNFDETWNCVAVSKKSYFSDACEGLVVK